MIRQQNKFMQAKWINSEQSNHGLETHINPSTDSALPNNDLVWIIIRYKVNIAGICLEPFD